MATYYKYQKRDEGAQIDWATIGKNISDGLFEEVKVREQKKEKIQKDTNEAITFLNQYELGSSQSANQFIMNSSAQARDYLSMQNKLLKQGLLKPSDYNLGMQTLKDDYTQLSTAMKNFNTTYSEALGNLNDPSKKASKQYEKLMERYFGFADLSNKTTVVNPVDGRLYIATIGKDGQIDKNPSKLMSVSSIQNQASPFLGEYDLNGAVKTFVDGLGKYVVAGEILTKSSIKQNDSYKEAENDAVKAIVGASPTQTASILADHSDYSFVFEGGECDQKNKSKCIKLVAQENGGFAPELTEEQREEAERIVRTKIDVGIDEINERQKQSAYDRNYTLNMGRKQNNAQNLYRTIGNIFNEDSKVSSESLTKLKNLDKRINEFKIVGDTIQVEVDDLTTDPINLRDINGNPKSKQQITTELFTLLNTDTDIGDDYLDRLNEQNPSLDISIQDYTQEGVYNPEYTRTATPFNVFTVDKLSSNLNNKVYGVLNDPIAFDLLQTTKNEAENLLNLAIGNVKGIEDYSFKVTTPGFPDDATTSAQEVTSFNVSLVDNKGNEVVIGDLKKLPINKFLNTVNEKVKEIQKTSPPETNLQTDGAKDLNKLNLEGTPENPTPTKDETTDPYEGKTVEELKEIKKEIEKNDPADPEIETITERIETKTKEITKTAAEKEKYNKRVLTIEKMMKTNLNNLVGQQVKADSMSKWSKTFFSKRLKDLENGNLKSLKKLNYSEENLRSLLEDILSEQVKKQEKYTEGSKKRWIDEIIKRYETL